MMGFFSVLVIFTLSQGQPAALVELLPGHREERLGTCLRRCYDFQVHAGAFGARCFFHIHRTVSYSSN